MEIISVHLCEVLIKSNVIKKKYEDIYLYGILNMLMRSLGNAAMLTLGVLFEVPAFTIFFYISYSMIRTCYGGYHAKSRGVCFLFSNLIFVTDVLFSKYLYDSIPQITLIIILCGAGMLFQIIYYKDKKEIRFLTAGNKILIMYAVAEYLEVYELSKALFTAVISGLFLYLVNCRKGRNIPAEG